MSHTKLSGETISRSTEVYIEFLTKSLGASREEVLEVTKRSGISARRIAEYLLENQSGLNIEPGDLNMS
jgi:hypothetical protein